MPAGLGGDSKKPAGPAPPEPPPQATPPASPFLDPRGRSPTGPARRGIYAPPPRPCPRVSLASPGGAPPPPAAADESHLDLVTARGVDYGHAGSAQRRHCGQAPRGLEELPSRGGWSIVAVHGLSLLEH